MFSLKFIEGCGDSENLVLVHKIGKDTEDFMYVPVFLPGDIGSPGLNAFLCHGPAMCVLMESFM